MKQLFKIHNNQLIWIVNTNSTYFLIIRANQRKAINYICWEKCFKLVKLLKRCYSSLIITIITGITAAGDLVGNVGDMSKTCHKMSVLSGNFENDIGPHDFSKVRLYTLYKFHTLLYVLVKII